MKRGSLGAIVALLALIGGSAWWLHQADREIQRSHSAEEILSVFDESSEPAPPLASGAVSLPPPRREPKPFIPKRVQRRVVVTEVAETARALNAPGGTAGEDLEILHNLVEFFREANDGANPRGGLNEEIVDQLRGKNAAGIAVLSPDYPLNPEGQLTDRWNTPYFFHAISARELEIRSAGPDRKMWTEDDVF